MEKVDLAPAAAGTVGAAGDVGKSSGRVNGDRCRVDNLLLLLLLFHTNERYNNEIK